MLFVVIAAFFGGFYFYKIWWPEKQLKIDNGLAESKFPWRNYTDAELEAMYPQIKNAAIPTRTTPEQTYASFREALRTNNLELAVAQLYEEGKRYEENSQFLEDEYAASRFKELYGHYSEKIMRANMYEAIAQYEYSYFSKKYSQDLIGTIDFTKNTSGDWKMDSL